MTVLLALALLVAVAALGASAATWAHRLGARGLEVPVAAAPLAAAVAGIQALLLGLAGLGGSPVALTAAAVATWLVTGRPVPRLPPLRPPGLLGGLLAGAGFAWLAWILRHPGLGIDPLTYHLPESILWVQSGRPGAVELLQYEFPQGDYPVTNELLVAWLTGIARGVGPALLWTPAVALLAAVAGWIGLRRAGADRLVGGWALAALLLSPIAFTQLIGPHTDLPALAWLWCCAALVLCARDRPALVIPALAAAGLALGTKTTAAPLLVLLLLWAALVQRRRWRRLGPPVLVGAALAVGAGGVWYLRNLVLHGSPLYPFKAAPWGTPMPEFLSRLDASFLSRPGATLARNGGVYLDAVAGGFVVLALGLLVPPLVVALRRSPGGLGPGAWRAPRRALVAVAVTLVGVVTWTSAPFTGAGPDPALDVSATTVRYLLPTLSVAALALALGARGAPRWVRAALAAVLALACAWSVLQGQRLSVLAIPSVATLAAGAVAGAVAVVAWRWLAVQDESLHRFRLPAAAGPGPVRVAVAAVVALVLVVGAGRGFVARQGGAPFLASSGVVTWAAQQAPFRDDAFPVAFAPQLLAPLAGERLQHDIELIGRTEDCASVRRRAAVGWVVVGTFPFADKRLPFSAPGCLEGARPLYDDGVYAVFGPPQTATRSNAPAASSVRKKSSAVIAAARGSGSPARERVSSVS